MKTRCMLSAPTLIHVCVCVYAECICINRKFEIFQLFSSIDVGGSEKSRLLCSSVWCHKLIAKVNK